MIYKIYFFIRYILTFIKFWIVNRRFKKEGFRRYEFSFYEKISKKKGGGFTKPVKIKVKAYAQYECDSELNEVLVVATTLESAFLIIRDTHSAIFQECDHLTHKEII